MSKVEHNGIYYDPHNEIVCDNLRLKEIIEENETLKNRVADLEAKLAESNESHHKNIVELTKMATEKDRKIEELKQQLAEKESALKEYHDWLDQYHLNPYQIHLHITGLKVQLAEKENEIEKLTKLKAKEMGKSLYGIVGSLEKITNESVNMAKSHQDKISFAVEQLEKVKKFVIRQLFITTKGCSDLDKAEAKGCNELREETIKEIDNQIEELKKEMK